MSLQNENCLPFSQVTGMPENTSEANCAPAMPQSKVMREAEVRILLDDSMIVSSKRVLDSEKSCCCS